LGFIRGDRKGEIYKQRHCAAELLGSRGRTRSDELQHQLHQYSSYRTAGGSPGRLLAVRTDVPLVGCCSRRAGRRRVPLNIYRWVHGFPHMCECQMTLQKQLTKGNSPTEDTPQDAVTNMPRLHLHNGVHKTPKIKWPYTVQGYYVSNYNNA
jgi:hypothetical protein